MYTIKKRGKTAQDHLIEKKYEHTLTFTIADIEAHQRLLEKTLKEFSAQLALEEAKRDNIRGHNKWLNTMSPEKIHAAYMFHSAMMLIAQYNPKIKEIKKQLKEYAQELKDIKDTLGLKDIEAPVLKDK